jgi:hypothetical protein
VESFGRVSTGGWRGERPVRLFPSIQADSALHIEGQQWPKAAICRNNGAFMKISLRNFQPIDL